MKVSAPLRLILRFNALLLFLLFVVVAVQIGYLSNELALAREEGLITLLCFKGMIHAISIITIALMVTMLMRLPWEETPGSDRLPPILIFFLTIINTMGVASIHIPTLMTFAKEAPSNFGTWPESIIYIGTFLMFLSLGLLAWIKYDRVLKTLDK
jgi:hypothetical protein